MNKSGGMVLRDVVFMIIIFSGIIALGSIFVQQIGDSYDNTNMTASYNQDALGKNKLNETASKWEKIGDNLGGNLLQMLLGTLQAAAEILKEVLLAPNTFANMIGSILEGFAGIDSDLISIIEFVISAVLYILIVFVIISAFLKGGKL